MASIGDGFGEILHTKITLIPSNDTTCGTNGLTAMDYLENMVNHRLDQ